MKPLRRHRAACARCRGHRSRRSAQATRAVPRARRATRSTCIAAEYYGDRTTRCFIVVENKLKDARVRPASGSHSGHARDHDRQGRHVRVARADATSAIATRAVCWPSSTMRAVERDARDRHRADDPDPDHAHRDRHRDHSRRSRRCTSATRSTPTMLAPLQLPRQDVAREGRVDRSCRCSKVRVRDASCRRSIRSRRRAATSSTARRAELAQPRCPPRARRGCRATSRASRTRSSRSPTKIDYPRHRRPRSRSACCSARRTSRSTTTQRAVAAFTRVLERKPRTSSSRTTTRRK